VTAGKPPHDFVGVSAQPADGHCGLRHLLRLHSAERIEDAIDDDAVRPRGPVARNERADILCLEKLALWVAWRRRMAHAELVSIGESDGYASSRQLGKDVPRNRGLADPSRTSDPQDWDPITRH
jgi:hypothetical protein